MMTFFSDFDFKKQPTWILAEWNTPCNLFHLDPFCTGNEEIHDYWWSLRMSFFVGLLFRCNRNCLFLNVWSDMFKKQHKLKVLKIWQTLTNEQIWNPVNEERLRNGNILKSKLKKWVNFWNKVTCITKIVERYYSSHYEYDNCNKKFVTSFVT